MSDFRPGSRAFANFGVNGARVRIPDYLFAHLSSKTQAWIRQQEHCWREGGYWTIPIRNIEIPNELVLEEVFGEGAEISLAPAVKYYWIMNISAEPKLVIVRDNE